MDHRWFHSKMTVLLSSCPKVFSVCPSKPYMYLPSITMPPSHLYCPIHPSIPSNPFHRHWCFCLAAMRVSTLTVDVTGQRGHPELPDIDGLAVHVGLCDKKDRRLSLVRSMSLVRSTLLVMVDIILPVHAWMTGLSRPLVFWSSTLTGLTCVPRPRVRRIAGFQSHTRDSW